MILSLCSSITRRSGRFDLTHLFVIDRRLIKRSQSFQLRKQRGKGLLGRMQFWQVQFRGMLAADRCSSCDAAKYPAFANLNTPPPPTKNEKNRFIPARCALVCALGYRVKRKHPAAFGLIISHGPAFPISHGNLESPTNSLCLLL